MVSSGSSQGNLLSGDSNQRDNTDQKSPFEQYVQEAKNKHEDETGSKKPSRH